jgi:hypothetical protein
MSIKLKYLYKYSLEKDINRQQMYTLFIMKEIQ